MIRQDEDSLVCDLAETYGIYDYRSLPARTVATLSCGLRDDARIKMKLAGEKLTFEQMIQVKVYDLLNWIAWTKTKSAQEGGIPPKMLLEELLGPEKKTEEFAFSSGEEFETYRKMMLGGG